MTMYLRDDSWVYSPSDLTTFMESPFALWMNRNAYINKDFSDRDQKDDLRTELEKKGLTHETEVLEDLKKSKSVIDIGEAKLTHATDNKLKALATIEAMKAGVDVIYQAYLCDGAFEGLSDFLVKVEGKSNLGDFYYEVWDSKLATSVKPYFVIQLCCYAQMLEKIQGRLPENIAVVLGNKKIVKLKTEDYYYYYLALKNNFIKACDEFDPNKMLHPFDSKSYGNWSGFADAYLVGKDHLSQIANISRSQIKKLINAGVDTCAKLIKHEEHVKKIDSGILERLKKQASLQARSKDKEKPDFEIISYPPDTSAGLSLLPPKSKNDIFFDIEGYPLIEGGLEYLWGATYFDELGERQFKDFWAHDSEQEKLAFSQFIDWAYQRWIADPSMHIYHYASYEITACRKLMGRYGCYEFEVDQLLRNNVFVDLYKVVKSSMFVGAPSYSIKKVELLYRGKRGTEVADGGASIVVYENWRDEWLTGKASGSWEEDTTLAEIREYNKDDCDSTQELTDWLRKRQQESGIEFAGKITESDNIEVIEETPRDKLRELLFVKANDPLENDELLKKLYQHFAYTLDFHQRENKPMWWRLFDRMVTDTEELLDDADCLAKLVRTNREAFKQTPKARHLAYEFQFPVEQEWKAGCQNYYVLGEECEQGKPLKVSIVESESQFNIGLIVVKCKQTPPAIMHLIPDEYINASPIPESIEEVATDFLAQGLSQNAIFDFLKRSFPRIQHLPYGSPIITTDDPEERMNQVIEAVKNLDNSYFTIQGPPGTGKTFTAKKIIAELLKQNKRIGISSNSHKAINNLLFSVAEYCAEKKIAAEFSCAKDTDTKKIEELGINVADNKKLIANLPEHACVVGTTAWGFSHPDYAEQFDYLFIDEAGQVSVANLIGMSPSAKNIVILGDQMQLGQPTQGTHPGESGLSILDYLLGDTAAIAPEMGCFLSTTYRMHSLVNQFISDSIYEGKLKSHPDNERQKVVLAEGKLFQWLDYPVEQAGLIFRPVSHQGNTLASEEEVEEIAKLVDLLIGGEYTCREGKRRTITLDDMMFVAPYNYQVKLLKQRLGSDSKVGSVDKFQGQEAPIVFFSLCSSDAEESPRGVDFLYNKNRINVAVSRAQALAIVVGNPALCCPMINSIEQMKKINLVSRLMQVSS